MSDSPSLSACVLIIGNEILSGKTQDANLQFLALELARIGIKLQECRVIRDETNEIVTHLNECRAKYSYVFTTGGIGPTHDDITAASIAEAFGVELVVHPEAVRRLERTGREMSEARLRMARVPNGASLIDNPVSAAPGFRMENVFVLAGIPSIARAMFAAAAAELRHGKPIHSANVDVWLRESDFAEELERVALAHADVEIGSYPFSREGRFGANLVVRGTDPQVVEEVLQEVADAMTLLSSRMSQPK